MRGLFVGRFQPFHLGHAEMLTQVLKINGLEPLVIGIAEVEGLRTLKNPFTHAERAMMVLQALRGMSATKSPRNCHSSPALCYASRTICPCIV